MRKRSLLAAGMLSVLLATSACGAMTGATNSPAQPPGPANTEPEASFSAMYDMSSDEIGTTQRAAAAAAAKKAEEAGAAFVAARKTAARVQAAGRNPAAAARAVAPGLALKPAPAPLLPALFPKRSDNAADAAAPTQDGNQPVGPGASSRGDQHVTGTGTDEDPTTGDSGHCPATGEDADPPAGTPSDHANDRRDSNVEDDSDDCNDSQGGKCHGRDNAKGKNHSD